MSSVLKHDHADLLGIGRLSVLCPDLPCTLEATIAGDLRTDHFPMVPLPEPDLESPNVPQSRFTTSRGIQSLVSVVTRCWALLPVQLPKLVGAGTMMAWYTFMMRRIALREEADYSVGGIEAVLRMWLWRAPDSRPRRDQRGVVRTILESWWAMGVIGLFLGFVLGTGFSI